jgi:hypothetical protein
MAASVQTTGIPTTSGPALHSSVASDSPPGSVSALPAPGENGNADGGATAIAGSSALKPSSTISAPPPLARIPGRTISTGTPNKVAMP